MQRSFGDSLAAWEPGIVAGLAVAALVVISAGWLLRRQFKARRSALVATAAGSLYLTVAQLQARQARDHLEWQLEREAAFRQEFCARAEESAMRRADEEDARLVASVSAEDWPTVEDENANAVTTGFAVIADTAPEPESISVWGIPEQRRPSRNRPYRGLRPRPRPVSSAKSVA
ncbi:hypothetical protein [Amycolatopsis saalfeldensis]|uniref:PEP-CTERM protein-sorting domain-containing protein n=1 Tax=Amycolatopsis saalfeldensis TaxID=394193 RepID=A0A1H8YQ05_9PSEU|nr:hypothetical protein [Amycolatopsis saalfeldensis]SEP54081.1 PEP-CTERM protein-sorting domain-containing protein [Amycolatopsis saalfeldensis]